MRYSRRMIDVTRIRAITLDLDDTLWPIWPTIAKAEAVLLQWLAQHAPGTAEHLGDTDKVRALREMNVRETIFLGVLGLSVLWMGVYPKPITQSMNASVARLVQHVSTSKLQ